MKSKQKRALVVSGGVLGLAVLAAATVGVIQSAGSFWDQDRVSAQYGAYLSEVQALQTDIAHAHCSQQRSVYNGIGTAEVLLSQLDAGKVPSESSVYDGEALESLRESIDAAVSAASSSAYTSVEKSSAEAYASTYGADYDVCVEAVSDEYSASIPQLVNGDTVQTLLGERNRLTEELVLALDTPPDLRPETLAAATNGVSASLKQVIDTASNANELRGRNWLAGSVAVDYYRNSTTSLQEAYQKWEETGVASDLVAVVDMLSTKDTAYSLLVSSHAKGVAESVKVEWRQERLAEIRRQEEAEARRLAEEEAERLAEEERQREEEERQREEEEREREEAQNPTPTPTPTPQPTNPVEPPGGDNVED